MSTQTLPQPGYRLIQGRWCYSAAWLDDERPRTAMAALERARAAWRWQHQQLEIDLDQEEDEQ